MSQVLPFYLVCDESGSMKGEPLRAINSSLPDIHSEIGSNPVVADKTRFCVIGFSGQARMVLPLSDLSAVAQMPALGYRTGGTHYGAAFQMLFDAIENDVRTLKAGGGQVYRPAVSFLSDGKPNDKNSRRRTSASPTPAGRCTLISWRLASARPIRPFSGGSRPCRRLSPNREWDGNSPGQLGLPARGQRRPRPRRPGQRSRLHDAPGRSGLAEEAVAGAKSWLVAYGRPSSPGLGVSRSGGDYHHSLKQLGPSSAVD